MTLLEAKDKAAQEFGYEHFMDATQSVEDDLEYDDIICLAMTIYAESKAKEAWNAACQLQINNCLDALRPTFSDSLAYGDVASAKYPDYETYKTKQNA